MLGNQGEFWAKRGGFEQIKRLFSKAHLSEPTSADLGIVDGGLVTVSFLDKNSESKSADPGYLP